MAPLELITDFGSQFVNDMLTQFYKEMVIKHNTTIPFSKDNGIVERANKPSHTKHFPINVIQKLVKFIMYDETRDEQFD